MRASLALRANRSGMAEREPIVEQDVITVKSGTPTEKTSQHTDERFR
jgi:hypothetical protein